MSPTPRPRRSHLRRQLKPLGFRIGLPLPGNCRGSSPDLTDAQLTCIEPPHSLLITSSCKVCTPRGRAQPPTLPRRTLPGSAPIGATWIESRPVSDSSFSPGPLSAPCRQVSSSMSHTPINSFVPGTQCT